MVLENNTTIVVYWIFLLFEHNNSWQGEIYIDKIGDSYMKKTNIEGMVYMCLTLERKKEIEQNFEKYLVD